ncbi:hypothetical protein MMC28_006571 [Mycoblastus sanguinarius]|nr:hypothetical protein [Mycoblastus sanguinarius]
MESPNLQYKSRLVTSQPTKLSKNTGYSSDNAACFAPSVYRRSACDAKHTPPPAYNWTDDRNPNTHLACSYEYIKALADNGMSYEDFRLLTKPQREKGIWDPSVWIERYQKAKVETAAFERHQQTLRLHSTRCRPSKFSSKVSEAWVKKIEGICEALGSKGDDDRDIMTTSLLKGFGFTTRRSVNLLASVGEQRQNHCKRCGTTIQLRH